MQWIADQQDPVNAKPDDSFASARTAKSYARWSLQDGGRWNTMLDSELAPHLTFAGIIWRRGAASENQVFHLLLWSRAIASLIPLAINWRRLLPMLQRRTTAASSRGHCTTAPYKMICPAVVRNPMVINRISTSRPRTNGRLE